MLKTPLASVRTPFLDPLTITFAFANGTSFLSVTLPVIVKFSCDKMLVQKKSSAATVKQFFFDLKHAKNFNIIVMEFDVL